MARRVSGTIGTQSGTANLRASMRHLPPVQMQTAASALVRSVLDAIEFSLALPPRQLFREICFCRLAVLPGERGGCWIPSLMRMTARRQCRSSATVGYQMLHDVVFVDSKYRRDAILTTTSTLTSACLTVPACASASNASRWDVLVACWARPRTPAGTGEDDTRKGLDTRHNA